MGRPSKLTGLQAAFRDAYITMDAPSAGGAYLKVRPNASRSTADTEGFRLLRNPKVASAIQEAMTERGKRTEVTADFVLKNIMEIGQRCMQKYPVMIGKGKDREQLKELVVTEDGEEVLAEVFEFDSQGALRAQELLGKHLKLFTDKVEHSGTVTLEQLITGDKP